jgi:flagellar biosynthesis/type III secretory pathway protein FliH
MNNYTDVDPRVDTSKAEAKTDRLIKQAKDLERKDTNPFKQIQKQFDKKGINERAEDAVEGVNRSAQETADGVAKGTRKGFGNLKENAKSFKEDVKSAVGDMKQNASEETEKIERNARKNS